MVCHTYVVHAHAWVSLSSTDSLVAGHGTCSAWLCGDELLGMSPYSGPNAPLPDRVSVPRMIVAQFDSIRNERIYKKLSPWVLRTLETFLTSCNKEAWFTVFLATFLLLHQTARTCADRYRYAKQNAGKAEPVRSPGSAMFLGPGPSADEKHCLRTPDMEPSITPSPASSRKCSMVP